MASPRNKNIPGFVYKLWSIVEEPALDPVICWSESGNSFCIMDEDIFAKEVLPKYFKHSNIPSFIRQLHLYGFRKVIFDSVFQAKVNKVMEYHHPLFQKGNTSLMENIKRKGPVMKNNVGIHPDDLQRMITEMHEINEMQNTMNGRFENLKVEYEVLLHELINLRQKNYQQQQLSTKLLQLILNITSRNSAINTNRKRSFPAMPEAPAAKCAHQCFHFPAEKKKEAVEILTSDYELFEDKVLVDNLLTTLKDESKNVTATQTNGNDRKGFEMSIQNIAMSEESPTINLDVVKTECERPVTPESFEQKTKNISLELAPSSQGSNLTFTEDKPSTSYQIITNRNEMPMHHFEANVVEMKSLLSRKKMNYDSDHANKLVNFELSELRPNGNEIFPNKDVTAESDGPDIRKNEENEINLLEDSGNKDKQVVKYVRNPLLSLIEKMLRSNLGVKPQDSKDHFSDNENPSNILPKLVPYQVLERNLGKLSPKQLLRTEKGNPELMQKTDAFWKMHCNRDFKYEKPREQESWREMYLRLHDAREKHLQQVTMAIRAAQATKYRRRQAKMIFLKGVAGSTQAPPRHSSHSSCFTPVPERPALAARANIPSELRATKPTAKKPAPLMAKAIRDFKRYSHR
ncbi:heat shock factor protein 3-like isoform X2 [Ochotona princeps]|uniref:heat shock factor protein 3-like isoform X2 n=1 Tax=Ochotona princeps TaxID=9978 RepID=UPI002714A037|nr:heat shock factor protein 3-like isoform X2 [Ochotona princeps]